MQESSLHVAVHYEDGGFWAQVKEWPGCFATGKTLTELAEALEEAVNLYMTPEDEAGREGEGDGGEDHEALPAAEEDLPAIRLHILEMELTIAAERPLVPARWDVTAEPMPQPPHRRDPHDRWHLRGFHRRGEQ